MFRKILLEQIMKMCKGHDRPASWVKLKRNKKVAKKKERNKKQTKKTFFSPLLVQPGDSINC